MLLLYKLARAKVATETDEVLEGYFDRLRQLNGRCKYVFDMPKPKD